MKRLSLTLLAVATAVHLGSQIADVDAGSTITKPLLMILLAWYVAVAARPPLRTPLAAAVLFGWLGDVLLQLDDPSMFLGGMGAFAVGHVWYQVTAIRFGRWRTRRVAVAAGCYALVLVALLAWLWPGLPGDLRGPMVVYSLLLTGTAVLTVGIGVRAAIGGALFLISDSLIATGIAHTWRPPAVDVWVMATYVAAQFLLVTGFLSGARIPSSEPKVTA